MKPNCKDCKGYYLNLNINENNKKRLYVKYGCKWCNINYDELLH